MSGKSHRGECLGWNRGGGGGGGPRGRKFFKGTEKIGRKIPEDGECPGKVLEGKALDGMSVEEGAREGGC